MSKNEPEVEQKIARLAELDEAQQSIKQERDEIEVYFQLLAEEELRNSKRKTISYRSGERRVAVTLAKKVTMQYPEFIKQVFAKIAKDIIKEDVKLSLTTVGARILGGICAGEYVKQTVDEVLAQLADAEYIPLLKKKVRGKNYEGDIKNLMTITGCTEQQAAEDAWIVAEAAVWQELRRILISNKVPEEAWPDIIADIQTGVVVEELPKVKFE